MFNKIFYHKLYVNIIQINVTFYDIVLCMNNFHAVNLRLMKIASKFKEITSKVDFVQLEHEMLDFWEKDKTFQKCREKILVDQNGLLLMDQ